MDKLEQVIKKYLKEKAANSGWERSEDCPSEVLLSDYLQGRLSQREKEEVERHIADCPLCLDILVVAKDVTKENKKHYLKTLKILKYKWPIGAGISLILSFFFPRYFLQFLIITLILGLKWAFEGEGAKNLIIMVLRSLHKEEKEETPLRKKF
jgi:hypothetical protein